jgi:hypothetical protein
VIALALYAVFCLVFAHWNAVRIEQDKPINHEQNAMLHGIFYGIAIFVNFFTHEWLLLLAMPFVGRLFFDTALNLFRGLSLWYVSPWLEDPQQQEKVSKIDRIEYKVFHNALLPKILYFVLLLTILIIYYA